MHIIVALLFAAVGCMFARALIPEGTPQLLACCLAIVAAFGWGWGGNRVIPDNGSQTPNYVLSVVLALAGLFILLRLTHAF
jgi:uncharacterized membrane protein YeaQ/YmgE (transglycosylase-associated protein family)